LPGTPAILKAGDLALFSSTTFHRSGANQTPKLRRLFLMQYTAEPIHNPDGRPRHWAEPLNRTAVS
jgi:ectoine hydroxylase-related dioxygenase (phytanoyl-CoA dioxygenase family)